MKTLFSLLSSAAILGLAAPVMAQERGDMTLGFGIHGVMPDSGSNTRAGRVSVDDNVRPTLTFEYFVADRIGIEVLAAWPFEHDFKVGGSKAGKTKHLPPTVSVQYHFVNESTITPFVGVGLNYTHFWDEKGTGALAGARVSMDDSWGVALHAGIDVALSENSALRADLRWIDIDTKVKVNGTSIGKVHVDPLVAGLAYVIKF